LVGLISEIDLGMMALFLTLTFTYTKPFEGQAQEIEKYLENVDRPKAEIPYNIQARITLACAIASGLFVLHLILTNAFSNAFDIVYYYEGIPLPISVLAEAPVSLVVAFALYWHLDFTFLLGKARKWTRLSSKNPDDNDDNNNDEDNENSPEKGSITAKSS